FVGADGRIEKYVSIRTDITARKRAEALLQATNEELVVARHAAEAASMAKSEFLANMSHEIRTPLTAVLGYADLLAEDGDGTSAQCGQTIDTIRNAGKHLLVVINDILDLSKIEAGQMTVERIDTPLVGILSEVESLMRPRAAGKGLRVTTAFGTAVPERILSDPTRLRQILMNLVGNAVKFTEEGTVTSTVSVAGEGASQRLLIDVEDSGPGMTADQAGRLFQAFGQADATVTRRHGGTGLGLMISRRLADMMGGEVVLMCTELGKGSCFRIILPIEPAPGAAMIDRLEAVKATTWTKAAAQPACLAGRILLVEDGADNQRLIAFHLKKAGAEVDVAENGKIALEMLDKAAAQGRPFDLLLTDMQMPVMDGYALARVLRSRGSTLAIVALTAHAMAEDHARCCEAGCDDYATKPIDKVKLLEVCAKWMGKRGGGIAAQAA
ncbi:MAG: ATP-binding protein, partial [Phycisphaerales bacterium]|nr:ATP-binding protein [Phycisphaerales bacterium]